MVDDAIRAAVDSYVASIRSPHLSGRALRSVRKWSVYLEGRGRSVETATAWDAEAFVADWPWGSESLRHAIYALRGLHRHLVASGITPGPNPFDSIPVVPQARPRGGGAKCRA